jgi:hypothetical protein
MSSYTHVTPNDNQQVVGPKGFLLPCDGHLFGRRLHDACLPASCLPACLPVMGLHLVLLDWETGPRLSEGLFRSRGQRSLNRKAGSSCLDTILLVLLLVLIAQSCIESETAIESVDANLAVNKYPI